MLGSARLKAGPGPPVPGLRWLTGSVQGKLLAYLLPLVMISTIIVFGLFEWNARRSAEAQLHAKLDKMAEIQSAVVAEALWNVADEQIKLILAAVMTDEDVLAVSVLDEQDRIVAALGAPDAFERSAFTARRDILYDTGESALRIGTLEIALSEARLTELARERLTLALILAGILMAAVVTATLIVNRRIIGRPLSLLMASISRVASSAPRARVDWDSGDEIGRVVAAFNEMQARQDAYEAQLRATNDELERRVEERTAELAGAEATARQARGQLADAIGSISEGFALFDEADRLVVANRRYREIMLGDGDDADALGPGLSFEALLRGSVETGAFPNARPDPESWIQRQLSRHRRPGAPYVQEMRGNRWLQVSNRRTSEGGTVAVHSDITEIKRISDELKHAKEAAEAANEAKSAFLATMSHEIRTPLNGIIGMSTLLAGTDLDEEQRDFSDTIVTAADSLLTIISDILDFSKVEAGALELEQTPMDLGETIEAAVEIVAPKAAEKDVELACRINPDVPAGMIGDQVRLKQILMNLLNNAVKFTAKGEVVLTVSSMMPDAGRIPGETVLLTFEVRDTGIGIPEERMNRLFKSFSQVDASTTRRYGGTGLGLVITKRLVELMGGEISVTSTPGRGTTFSFTLPGEVAAIPDRASRERQLAALRGARILVVDDNRTNRIILSERFRAWDLVPHSCGDPQEALDLLAEGRVFDVVVVDYKMPHMNGFEFTNAVRERLKAAAPPMILFSSISPMEGRFREAVAEMGYAAALTKPAKSGQLLQALVRILAPAQMPASRGTPPGQAEGAEQNDLRVLLVDDNAINRKVGSKILKRLGIAPVVTGSGAGAIEACRGDAFDIVLMDIEMPEMDGVTATQKIRESLSEDETPYIVALTANAMHSERETYLRSGFDDYLSKPIDVEALVASLDAARRLRETRLGAAAAGP